VEKQLRAQADTIGRRIGDALARRPSASRWGRLTSDLRTSSAAKIEFLSPDGNPFSIEKASKSAALPPRASPVSSVRAPHYALSGNRLFEYAPIMLGGKTVGAVRLTYPLDDAREAALRLTLLALALLGLFGTLILALLLWMTGSLLRSVRSLSAGFRRMADGDLSQRIRTRSPDEIGDLTRAANSAMQSLEGRIDHLREEETTMRAAFAYMADGVAALDAEGRILLFNGVAEETFGRNATQALGRTILEITLHPDLDALVTKTLETGARSESEIQLRHPSHRILRAFVTPVPSREDSLLGAVLVFQDLTEIRRLESVRRDFVTNASHELKTPLATINVMAESLLAGMDEDPATAHRFLSTIASEMRRLGALVDDLLDLSRIESDNMPMEMEAVSLKEIVRMVARTFRPAAESRGQKLIDDARRDAWIRGDSNAVIRMAFNLTENALKYTPDHGRIELSCGTQGDRAYLRVKDTGVGIPKAEQSRVFERFYRVDKARSRATGGAGLGLSIVKRLAEAHDGSVEAESEPGRGSAFTLWFPALPEKPEE
jgi:two-component system phosphate regulon sensor histidine kinase PhoR